MSAGARLPEPAAAKLLLAAGLIDAAFVFFLLELTGALLRAILASVAPGLLMDTSGFAPEVQTAIEGSLYFAFFLAMLIFYWIICDAFLGGRSVGRAMQMLSPTRYDGARATGWQMSKRALLKVSRLGLTGLSLSRQAGYDRSTKVGWRSPIMPGNERSTRNWTIEILGGKSKGRSQVLGRMDRFNRHGVIQIGRDPNWADVVLNEDERVSSRHAILRSYKGRWELCDYGGGKGSSNKTRVGDRVLPPMTWVPIQPSKTIYVGNVPLRLQRGG